MNYGHRVLLLIAFVLPPLSPLLVSEPTTTSEGSVIEARIRLLKERLRQRKEEVKRVQSEQKRKKKAILRQREEQLQKKLEVRMVG